MNENNITMEGQISTNGKGAGFFRNPDLKEDIFIDNSNLNRALTGDTVRIRRLANDEKGRPTGEVIAILSRAREQFVGTVLKEENAVFVNPDNHKIYVNFLLDKDSADKVEINQKVLIKMTKWEEGEPHPHAALVKIFGQKGEHEVEIQSIIYEKGFISEFPANVEKEAEEMKKKWTPIPESEIAKRRDIREKDVFTIDPYDAKDFDDALHIEKLDNGNFEVGVHIADVSNYVLPDSALDDEAFHRATSVYMVDRTIPMLPEILSNDLCSLNPNEDKTAFSAIFELDPNAVVQKKWFGKTVINSKKRFTYEEAQAILDADSGPFIEELRNINILAKKLAARKSAAGAISFEKDEIKFELDKDGRPLRIIKKERMDTHKLVEDMMLLANREVAKFIFEKGKEMNAGEEMGLMYRIHDVPNIDKVADLSVFLKALGYILPVDDEGEITAKDLNALMMQVEGKAEEALVKSAAIKTMSKAIYSTENTGHFGLAFEYYTHFTSPIRRYPDLVVHRILMHFLAGEKPSKADLIKFEEAAKISTEREISAAEAERESIRYKQAEYMMDHIGDVFEGVISGVTNWGVYVQLNETLTEGMIHVSKLGNDFFTLDEKNYRMVGEKTGKKFSLGDSVKVKISEIDLDQKRISMVLVEAK